MQVVPENTRDVDVGLTARDYSRLASRLERETGIHLPPGKHELLRSRLRRRLSILGVESFAAYADLLESDASSEELRHFIDALTTNETSFFREPEHFDFLSSVLGSMPRACGAEIRVWSAACSSGEEPYSIAIASQRAGLVEPKAMRILATDVCRPVLQRAREAVYSRERVERHPWASAFFESASDTEVRVKAATRSMVRFALLNLQRSWPMTGPFDFIFCRNVMIYFTPETREWLAGRFRRLLRPGGHLLIGHSETLGPSPTGWHCVKPSIYRKVS